MRCMERFQIVSDGCSSQFVLCVFAFFVMVQPSLVERITASVKIVMYLGVLCPKLRQICLSGLVATNGDNF